MPTVPGRTFACGSRRTYQVPVATRSCDCGVQTANEQRVCTSCLNDGGALLRERRRLKQEDMIVAPCSPSPMFIDARCRRARLPR